MVRGRDGRRHAQFEVQVAAPGEAGGSFGAEACAGCHLLGFLDGDRAPLEVGVDRLDAVAVVDHNAVAELAHASGGRDGARTSGEYRRTASLRHVIALVVRGAVGASLDRVKAETTTFGVTAREWVAPFADDDRCASVDRPGLRCGCTVRCDGKRKRNEWSDDSSARQSYRQHREQNQAAQRL